MIGEKGGKRSFFLHFLHSWFLAVVNGFEELEVLSICAMSYFDCVHEANSLRVPKFNSMKEKNSKREKNKQHTHNSSNVKKLSCMISAHVRTAHLNCHQFIRRVVQIISLSFFKQFVALLLSWCIVECFFLRVVILTRCCLICCFFRCLSVFLCLISNHLGWAAAMSSHVYSYFIPIWIISLLFFCSFCEYSVYVCSIYWFLFVPSFNAYIRWQKETIH